MQTITLAPKTVQVLKNFSGLNPGIYVKQGSELFTCTPSKTVFARAKIDQEFDSSFAIDDLPAFLGALSLFEDPSLEIEEKVATIRKEKQALRYTWSSPEVVVYPEKTNIRDQPAMAEFELTAKDSVKVSRALSTLKLSSYVVRGDGEKVKFEAYSPNNKSSHLFSVEVGETDQTFSAIISPENLRLFPEVDYKVKVTKRYVDFDGEWIRYIVSVEKESTFE